MISDKLLQMVRCPDCVADPPAGANPATWGSLTVEAGKLVCAACGQGYDYRPALGYLGLLPQGEQFASGGHFGHTTKYVEHHDEFERALDYEHISEPLLGAGVRNATLRKLLRLHRNDRALEVGCGNGKFAYWNRRRVDHMIGLDASPLFASEALNAVDLVRGDARALPFAPATFNVIFSLDLMEHLTAADVGQMFREMRRVLKPGGRVMIYSNTREKSPLYPLIAGSRKVGDLLEGVGLADFKRDRLRKSDHIKEIATFDQLKAVIDQAGFVLEEAVFWNGVFQSLTENVIAKVGEAVFTRRKVRQLEPVAAGLPTDHAHEDAADHAHDLPDAAQDAAAKAARQEVKRKIAEGGLYRTGLLGLTRLMLLDLVLFGKVQTGPFFVLLRAK